MALDVLVVGGGGREHALVSGLARSARIGRLFCAPGNVGIGRLAELVPIPADDLTALADFAERERIDLTVVGPEAPLVAGIAEVFAARGLTVFGPSAAAARMEGSKAFAKDVMRAAGVPTARAEAFASYESAAAYLREQGAPIVVKADGLAAGKGVVVAQTVEQADEALRWCFVDRVFGEAGRHRAARGVPGRRGTLAAGHRQRRPGGAPRPGPGLQAHLRRRRGREHRRHGLVLARAQRHPGAVRRGGGHRHRAHRRRAARPGASATGACSTRASC